MRSVQVHASGRFASRIAVALQDKVTCEGDHGGPVDAVVLLDAFDPQAVRKFLDHSAPTRTVLAFLTVRGFFVSTSLGAGSVCFNCFERRWLANLSSWEHSTSQEAMLQTLYQFQPALRPSSVSETVVSLAAALCIEQIKAHADDRRSLYADLTTGQIAWGETWGVHGCEACFPKGAGLKRHLVGLATMSSQLWKLKS